MRAAPSDGGRGPATERHACRPAPSNLAKSISTVLIVIKFRSDALRGLATVPRFCHFERR
jgi:hypothetical protein